MKIAMIGSGAAGSVFAAYLRRGGGELWLVDKYKAHMDKIAADGLVFRTPEGEEVRTGFHTAPTAREIGVMDMVDYSENEIYLNKNDMIFVYTDGITEAMNREEEQFGEKRMMDALNRNKGKNPTELLNGMLEAVREHTGDFEQSDDMTMLALRWLGND